MKRVAIVLGAVAAVLLGAVALVWFVPQVQDRIVQSAMTRQVAKAAPTMPCTFSSAAPARQCPT
ncbi:MAG TPA: hypothetical protein VIS50_03745 [Methyloceanibacter sp.]